MSKLHRISLLLGVAALAGACRAVIGYEDLTLGDGGPGMGGAMAQGPAMSSMTSSASAPMTSSSTASSSTGSVSTSSSGGCTGMLDGGAVASCQGMMGGACVSCCKMLAGNNATKKFTAFLVADCLCKPSCMCQSSGGQVACDVGGPCEGFCQDAGGMPDGTCAPCLDAQAKMCNQAVDECSNDCECFPILSCVSGCN